ncbi:MAG: hypothetical protein HY567_01530 [Candidatus Kerfeldbacteria bacterium]|nr:hypothetical protein [Candidatus Kerfeldbacteria bacterium]
MFSRPSGNWRRIAWMLIVLGVYQMVKRVYFKSIGIIEDGWFDSLVHMCTFFTVSMLVWTGIARLCAGPTNRHAPQWSAYIDLYLKTCFLMVVASLLDLTLLVTTGEFVRPFSFRPSPPTFEAVAQLIQLIWFFIWAAVITHQFNPQRREAPARGGVV